MLRHATMAMEAVFGMNLAGASDAVVLAVASAGLK